MKRAAGFTLLELMVVMVLMALLTGLSVPLISAALPGQQLRAASRDLLAGLRRARDDAVFHRRDVTLAVNLDQHDFRISGDPHPHAIAPKVEIALVVADAAPNGRSGAFHFYPDGSSSGGRVTVARNGRRIAIDVDWLTGLAHVQH